MDKIRILWADDEIDLLKPQLVFLERKGYEVETFSNGHDLLDELEENDLADVIFLDESMPGITGLDTLTRIKGTHPNIPVVMITKNEAENIMEEAIGSQISDYLIKPVNPNQILLTLKRIVDNKRLVQEKTALEYQSKFREIFLEINSGLDHDGWADICRKIIKWEIKLDNSQNDEMKEILLMQKKEANAEFVKFVKRNYLNWLKDESKAPILSHQLMRKKVFPHVGEQKPTIFLLMDNLRYDQWKVLESTISDLYRVKEEDYFYSILPTATQYSRNAIFSGMMPADISKYFRSKWLNDNDQGGKNQYEADFLYSLVNNTFRKPISHEYIKVTNLAGAKQLNDNILNCLNNDLTVIVYNFIDFNS